MARELDIVLVVDLEATCWENGPPEGQENEIIEIGLCPFDVSRRKRLEKRSILVRPETSEVSEFCTGLTTLTQEDVDGGIPLDEACALLRDEYDGQNRAWASWGDYDRRQLARECEAKEITYPFGPTHINAKTLFALKRGRRKECGLLEATDTLEMDFEGRHHRGVDDAWNVAAILDWILQGDDAHGRRLRGLEEETS
jgi:inhibitor of KinA sporulation pathway (predicted exonuclease)